MGDGLYLPNGEFVSFSQNHDNLFTEVATRQSAGFDYVGWLGLLPDPDPVLRKRGDGVEVLEELTADDQVCSAMQTRKLKTLNRQDYTYNVGQLKGEDPSPAAEKLCTELTRDLERLTLRNLMSEVLDSPYYGRTHFEILWEADGGWLRIKDLIAKPREWFGYNTSNQLTFLSMDSPEGVVPPERKFVTVRHFPTYKNPYGLSLLSRCLWPVAFKKGGVQFWIRFTEKFGFPWIIGQAPQNATEAERSQMLSSLSAMVQDAVAVVSQGSQIDIHEATGKAGSLHREQVKHWDAAVNQILMGQTLTSSDGDGKGSYALGKTHYAVLGDYAEADEALVVTFMNEVAWVYGQVNAPDAMCPTFGFIQPDDYTARAKLDKQLYSMGVRFNKKHFNAAYSLPEDEFEMASASAAGEPEFSEFADASDSAQVVLDEWVAEVMPDAVQANKALTRNVLKTIEQAESFEDLQLLLAELLGDRAATEELEDLVARVMLNADLFGQHAVLEADDA